MERDPFQPLSAKDSKRGFSSGGREQDAARAKMSRSAADKNLRLRLQQKLDDKAAAKRAKQ
jgi:hypothetical protein